MGREETPRHYEKTNSVPDDAISDFSTFHILRWRR